MLRRAVKYSIELYATSITIFVRYVMYMYMLIHDFAMVRDKFYLRALSIAWVAFFGLTNLEAAALKNRRVEFK